MEKINNKKENFYRNLSVSISFYLKKKNGSYFIVENYTSIDIIWMNLKCRYLIDYGSTYSNFFNSTTKY